MCDVASELSGFCVLVLRRALVVFLLTCTHSCVTMYGKFTRLGH